jgi:hypothetical protein
MIDLTHIPDPILSPKERQEKQRQINLDQQADEAQRRADATVTLNDSRKLLAGIEP